MRSPRTQEKWEQTKKFCADHKEEIAFGAILVVAGILSANTSDDSDPYDSDEDSDDDYSYNNLRWMSYDELNEIREDVRTDYQNDQREELLDRIDSIRYQVGNPKERHARSLSNEELINEFEDARNLYYEEYEIYKHDKRPYEELRHDEDYKKYQLDYDNFYQLMTEKERRYAEEHPDEFPIHREHGWYLPEDDD